MTNNNTKSMIYYLVAAYVAYMAFGIMNNRMHGDNTMSWPVAIILTAVLGIGAMGVAIYATRLIKRKPDERITDGETESEDKDI